MDEISDLFFMTTVNEFLLDPYYRRIEAFCAHGDWNVLEHSLNVAKLCYFLGKKRGLALDYRSLLRAAMLHDFYCYDWHLPHKGHRLHGFRHPKAALREANKRYPLSVFEQKLILGHMFPLTFWRLPTSKEAKLLIRCDRIAALYEHRYRHHDQGRPSIYLSAIPPAKGNL